MTFAEFIGFLEQNAGAENVLAVSSLQDTLVDHIEIKADTWGSPSALNVHAAQYMQAVQKDVILAWNSATGQNVTLSNIDSYPFLIVEFEITDGCISVKQTLKLVGAIMEKLSPTQKMIVFGMVFCGALAFCGAYAVGKLADTGFFDSDEIQKIKALAQQKESARVIINNLGGGTVVYGGREWDAEDLKKDRKSIDSVAVTEVQVLDGTYTIDTCKLEGGLHLASQEGKQFNADFDSLEEGKRKQLSERIGEAILGKRKLDQQFRIDATVKGGVIDRKSVV